MEHKEKKKPISKRRKTQSISTSSFPLDLTRDILSRLPEKSTARFRCVSKLWSSIITDPNFITLLETRRPRPTLLLCLKKDDELFAFSVPQHTQNSNTTYSSSLPIDIYHTKLPGEYSYLSPTESVHGLICFQESQNPIFMIWNPSMRSIVTLLNANTHKSWKKVAVFLGYDPIEGKHKVMCIRYKKTNYVCRVLTLGSAQESWRTVRTNHKHSAGYQTYGRCINGVIYYLADHENTFEFVLMSFDVRSEKFGMIKLRSDMHVSDIREDVLITYEGSIACADEDNHKRLWILEDAEKHNWSSQDFLVPLRHRDKSLKAKFNLLGFTHAGEFVYVPTKFRESRYILFCDPVRNSCRRFEFKGVKHDGVGKTHLYGFPNHIESQMSL
ncbi:unnamed protein product [Microthlaspi erraticum]|uniref:F-box domain-containing protein n=1 Tax=Microthlaspi erraticum TaxID=1685480 RepID=A0A6D2IRZ0_9BRAS|nr:unnamed protein product [Microthlaspi erraticum]